MSEESKKSVRYECLKCKNVIQSDAFPTNSICSKGENHVWIDLNQRRREIKVLFFVMVGFLVLGLILCWNGLLEEINTDFHSGNITMGIGIAALVVGFIFFRVLKNKRLRDEKIKPDNKRAIIVTTIGGVFILGSIITLIYAHGVDMEKRPTYFSLLTFLIHFTRDVGLAMLTAGIITMIIEVRNFVEFTAKSVISALTSDSYLDGLTEERLQEIKSSCSRRIIVANNNRKENNLNESLLDLETAVSKQLFLPYYEKYRIRIECEEVEAQKSGFTANVKLLKKKVHTTYTIINPKQGMGHEPIKIAYNLAQPTGMETDTVTPDIEKLLKLEKFTITVDDKTTENILPKVKFRFDIQPAAQVFKYDIEAELIKNELGGEKEYFTVSYDNKLVVESTEIIYVPIDDELYSRRLNKPTKYSSVFYQYKQPSDRDVKLQATCFCTLKEYYNAVTINGGSDYVEVICDNWLLPWNGYCIIHMPTAKKPVVKTDQSTTPAPTL